MHPTENYAVAAIKKDRGDEVQDFPTPCWATRALIEKILQPNDIPTNEMTVWEPAANKGFMVRPLSEYFGQVFATDKYNYNDRWPVLDFLSVSPHEVPPIDFTITNPPFHLAQEFIEKGLEVSRFGVAMLVRTSFLEGKKRHASLFTQYPPTAICQFVERVPMAKGRMKKETTTATSYCWLVWLKMVPPGAPAFLWIPPCRKELEREFDYDE
jgi:hypothetical protein